MAKKRKKKKKNPKKAVLKSRAEMTDREYATLVEGCSVELYEYIKVLNGGRISSESLDHIASAFGYEFRHRMGDDTAFFDKVNAFINGKTSPDQAGTDAFCRELIEDMYRHGRIKEYIAANYPDDYRLPENRADKKRSLKKLSRGR